MIGIVGGVGPSAGLDLHNKIIKNTVAIRDQQHIDVLLATLAASIPDRTAFLHALYRNDAENSAIKKSNPGTRIAEVAHRLFLAGATIIGVPCNTAHAKPIWQAMLDELQKKKILDKLRLVHMIDETFSEIVRHKIKKIGLMATLGTYASNAYHDNTNKKNINILTPPDEDKQLLQNAIYNPTWGVKASFTVSDQATKTMNDIANRLVAQGADAIIMGCTEIPLALEPNKVPILVIDPTLILARALIAHENAKKLLPV